MTTFYSASHFDFHLLIIGMGLCWVTFALFYAVRSLWRSRGLGRLSGFLGGIILAYGGAAFFALATSSGINLPPGCEWPVGRADELIQIPDGRRLAVNEASSRIQVYDRDWKFIRGWVVDASGGAFRARSLPGGWLEVWTARGARRYIFTLDGIEVEAGSHLPKGYMDLPVTDGPGDVPTPWLLWPLSSPFAAWMLGFAGMLLLRFSDPGFSRKNKSRGRNPLRSILGLLVLALFMGIAFIAGNLFPQAFYHPPPDPKPAPPVAPATPGPVATPQPSP